MDEGGKVAGRKALKRAPDLVQMNNKFDLLINDDGDDDENDANEQDQPENHSTQTVDVVKKAKMIKRQRQARKKPLARRRNSVAGDSWIDDMIRGIAAAEEVSESEWVGIVAETQTFVQQTDTA